MKRSTGAILVACMGVTQVYAPWWWNKKEDSSPKKEVVPHNGSGSDVGANLGKGTLQWMHQQGKEDAVAIAGLAYEGGKLAASVVSSPLFIAGVGAVGAWHVYRHFNPTKEEQSRMDRDAAAFDAQAAGSRAEIEQKKAEAAEHRERADFIQCRQGFRNCLQQNRLAPRFNGVPEPCLEGASDLASHGGKEEVERIVQPFNHYSPMARKNPLLRNNK
jgi:hypothetical protein